MQQRHAGGRQQRLQAYTMVLLEPTAARAPILTPSQLNLHAAATPPETRLSKYAHFFLQPQD